MANTKAIYFDMDGTLADLYGCENWLADLIDGYTRPYREAKSMVNMRRLGNLIHMLQERGYHVGIVSWLSKSGTEEYNTRVIKAKVNWLKRHLGSVAFDEIRIVSYGVPKSSVVNFPDGILFDDEAKNRSEWVGTAFNVDNIINTLAALL